MMTLIKHGNEILTTIKTIQEPTIMDKIINLLDVIIWPIALITFLFIFKSQIKGLMDRFKSLKISQSGAEIETIDAKINDVAINTGMSESDVLLIDEGSIIPKDGGSIIPKDGGSIIPKSSKSKTPLKSHAESPYQELLELKEVINQKLKSIANQNGINISTSSSFTLTSVLAEHNKISSDNAHKLKMLIELNNVGLNSSSKLTHDQVSKIKKIFNNISF